MRHLLRTCLIVVFFGCAKAPTFNARSSTEPGKPAVEKPVAENAVAAAETTSTPETRVEPSPVPFVKEEEAAPTKPPSIDSKEALPARTAPPATSADIFIVDKKEGYQPIQRNSVAVRSDFYKKFHHQWKIEAHAGAVDYATSPALPVKAGSLVTLNAKVGIKSTAAACQLVSSQLKIQNIDEAVTVPAAPSTLHGQFFSYQLCVWGVNEDGSVAKDSDSVFWFVKGDNPMQTRYTPQVYGGQTYVTTETNLSPVNVIYAFSESSQIQTKFHAEDCLPALESRAVLRIGYSTSGAHISVQLDSPLNGLPDGSSCRLRLWLKKPDGTEVTLGETFSIKTIE